MQFLIISNGKQNVSGGYAGLFVVTRRIAGQLQDLRWGKRGRIQSIISTVQKMLGKYTYTGIKQSDVSKY